MGGMTRAAGAAAIFAVAMARHHRLGVTGIANGAAEAAAGKWAWANQAPLNRSWTRTHASRAEYVQEHILR